MFCAVNSDFNEVIWFYPSKNSTQVDRNVTYNYAEKIWYIGTLARSSWADRGVYSNPYAAEFEASDTTATISTINGVKEKVLDGYELNLSSQLPFMPWTRINVQNYDFEKDKASENTGGNLVSLEMNLSPSIQFEASRNFIETTGVEDENSFKIMYYNPPRSKTSLQDGFISANAFEKGDIETKMKDKVKRRNAMTIEVQGAVILTKQ